jgi:hypothetical protein
MGWHSRDESERADYEHDQRKNWSPDIPLRLEPSPLSTAMDIALIVRGMTNLVEAAKLIEAYADAKAAATRMDAVRAGAQP